MKNSLRDNIELFDLQPCSVFCDDHLIDGLSVSLETIAAARQDGLLRFAKPGNRYIYLGSWVTDWLRAVSGGGNKNESAGPTLRRLPNGDMVDPTKVTSIRSYEFDDKTGEWVVVVDMFRSVDNSIHIVIKCSDATMAYQTRDAIASALGVKGV